MAKRNTNKGKTNIFGLIIVIIIGLAIFGNGGKSEHKNQTYHNKTAWQQKSTSSTNANKAVNNDSSISSTPNSSQPEVKHNDTQLSQLDYQNQQIIQVNNGQPTFTAEQLKTTNGAWATYQPLDGLGRATGATGLLNKNLMPHAKRQRLVVNPTGFRNRKVEINGHEEWLYNRSHLIGYQFTGQNNNLQNLVTGTRSLNDPGMSHYENMVAMYLRTHPDDYVRYQITPMYRGGELVPRGVQMQAQSINSQTIKFNIYIFNVQKGININYQNGYSTNN